MVVARVSDRQLVLPVLVTCVAPGINRASVSFIFVLPVSINLAHRVLTVRSEIGNYFIRRFVIGWIYQLSIFQVHAKLRQYGIQYILFSGFSIDHQVSSFAHVLADLVLHFSAKLSLGSAITSAERSSGILPVLRLIVSISNPLLTSAIRILLAAVCTE